MSRPIDEDGYITVERVSSRPYKRRKSSSDHQKRGSINRKHVTCQRCARYPCFPGIETVETNLATTCHEFKRKK